MRRPTLLAAMALAGLAAGCGSSSSAGPAAPQPANVVVIKNIAFHPATVTIHPGQDVVWKFEDGSTPHNVTGQGTDSGINSGIRSTGTYTYTFPVAGTYTYRCTIHSGMNGTVVVSP
jgi:plastocyanin